LQSIRTRRKGAMTTTLASPSTTPCEASDGWLGRRDGALCAEGIALAQIAEVVGTPFYAYSTRALRQSYATLAAAVTPLGVLRDVGAYGAAMSPTYNGRDLIPEVFVEGSHFRLIRKRAAIAEVLRLERAGPWQQAG
jgi:hypothetical protein